MELEDGCGGTRMLNCFCGGDFCACGVEEVPCPGCEDCDGEDFEEFTDMFGEDEL